ncbi:E3 ubiquitin-protein ligase MSL2 [Calliphora vicina]|uniref:E3 ubiquitin-protein ligase MSL2 n=1 Tax=Calliphora vicina TaxID=7373 RepID=UPI00325B4ED6
MNAVSVYVNTAKLVLQTTEATTAAAASLNPELSRLLLSLRQLLSCVVCNRLVNDPYVPQHGQCAHNVCRLCMRGQKLLHPACSHCKDNNNFKTYNENKQMRCLLMCYKSLCEHLRCSAVFSHFAGHKVGQYNSSSVPSVLMPQMSLQDLIVEGAGYDDILNAFNSDLPKPMMATMAKPMHLPALVTPLTSIAAATPLAPIQHTIKVAAMQQTAPKASTPPTSVTAAISIPVSTYTPKLKVDNSSHHHFKHHTPMATPTSSLSNTPSTQEHQTPMNTSVTHTQLIQLNQLKNSGNITYIGPNTRGIVLPIVSTAGSSGVPLTIASARLQTLNRQLAHARALAVSSASATAVNNSSTVNTSANSVEHRNPLATFKSSMASSQTMKTSMATFSSSPAITTTPTCVTTSAQMRNPPPIKTVSNGSAMYSVLYTGIGNKITIKRKTDGDEDATQKKNSSISTPNANLLRPLSKTPNKKRGCRCGNTTATPGKLTCCGQRCPCYVDSKSCIGCKCRGCRNPHRPDGNKVRPIIPELACYEIQMADDHGNVNELPIATTSNVLNTLSADNNATTNLTTTLNFNATTSTSAAAAIASTSSTSATLMPIRGLHHFTTSSIGNSCVTTSSIPPLTSTTMPTQTASMTQASFGANLASSATVQAAASSMSSNITAPGNIVQLDQIQRESLLIQNAEGKFQVVNVFTTTGANVGGSTSCTGQSSSQVPTLQRIKTLPQTVVSAHNSFVLPSSISSTTMSGTTTTTSLPQLILQSQQQQQHQHHHGQHILQHHQHHQQQQQQHHQQHQQQQQHLNHQSITSQRISNNVTATSSLPLQLQQQLKQNIITVHAIHTNPPTSNTSPVTAPVLTPSSSPAPTSATISLPPLITNNSHGGLELTDSSDGSRNTYTNIIVSSSSPCDNITTSSSSITSIPMTVSMAGNVHTQQSLNMKSLNSPNF